MLSGVLLPKDSWYVRLVWKSCHVFSLSQNTAIATASPSTNLGEWVSGSEREREMTQRKGGLAVLLYLEAPPPRVGVQLASWACSLPQSRDIASWCQLHHQLVDSTTISWPLLLVTPSGKSVIAPFLSAAPGKSVSRVLQSSISWNFQLLKIKRARPASSPGSSLPIAWAGLGRLDPDSRKILTFRKCLQIQCKSWKHILWQF